MLLDESRPSLPYFFLGDEVIFLLSVKAFKLLLRAPPYIRDGDTIRRDIVLGQPSSLVGGRSHDDK